MRSVFWKGDGVSFFGDARRILIIGYSKMKKTVTHAFKKIRDDNNMLPGLCASRIAQQKLVTAYSPDLIRRTFIISQN